MDRLRVVRVVLATVILAPIAALAACSSSDHETSVVGPDDGTRVEPSVSISPHGADAAPDFSTPGDPADRPTGDLSKGYEIEIDQLMVGDCLNYGSANDSITVISCELPHDMEVAGEASVETDADAYYEYDVHGQSAYERALFDVCQSTVKDYTGMDVDEDSVWYTTASENQFLGGDRSTMCIYGPNEVTTGSAKKS